MRYGSDAKLFEWSDDYSRLPTQAGEEFVRPVRGEVPGLDEIGLGTPQVSKHCRLAHAQ